MRRIEVIDVNRSEVNTPIEIELYEQRRSEAAFINIKRPTRKLFFITEVLIHDQFRARRTTRTKHSESDA